MRILSFCSVFLVLTSAAFGLNPLDDLLEGIPQEAIDQVMESGEAFRYDRDGIGMMLSPAHESASLVAARHESLNPDVVVEGLYLIPYPDDAEPGLTLDTYNLTRSISRIKDVIYFSHRRQDYVPLFDETYMIDDMRGRNPVEDPLVQSVPSFDSIVIHMDEVNLGSGYYRTDYVYQEDALSFSVTNITALRALIKVVDKEGMVINLVVFPTERGFLVYGYCGVRLSNKNLVFNMMDPYSGFYKRMLAIETWLHNSLHDESRRPDLKTPLPF